MGGRDEGVVGGGGRLCFLYCYIFLCFLIGTSCCLLLLLFCLVFPYIFFLCFLIGIFSCVFLYFLFVFSYGYFFPVVFFLIGISCCCVPLCTVGKPSHLPDTCANPCGQPCKTVSIIDKRLYVCMYRIALCHVTNNNN